MLLAYRALDQYLPLTFGQRRITFSVDVARGCGNRDRQEVDDSKFGFESSLENVGLRKRTRGDLPHSCLIWPRQLRPFAKFRNGTLTVVTKSEMVSVAEQLWHQDASVETGTLMGRFRCLPPPSVSSMFGNATSQAPAKLD
jgi:hypothetical protein